VTTSIQRRGDVFLMSAVSWTGPERNTSLNDRTEIAVAKFLEGYNCAQSVLYSYCDVIHFDKNTALKMACGLGAGMGRKGEVCGAVTGGILVIGAKYGRGERDDQTAKELAYEKTSELMDRFEKKHGTFICRKLLGGCELSTEEGQKYFKENELSHKTCKLCVQSVVEILDSIMEPA
jgi:C_GCAxxG_C_C family probable redox protein